MPAIEPLYHLAGMVSEKMCKNERFIIEAELFIRFCDALKEIYRARYREYFQTMKFNKNMEDNMLEGHFIKLIIEDILMTQEYTIEGIAHYTHIPNDVILEILDGRNTNPSALLLLKCIALHRTVRSELYRDIMKKIVAHFQQTQ